jgi:peroxiredoxin
LAEFQARLVEFRAAGWALAALSVDDPGRTQPVRERLGLEFPILCDQSRATLVAWDLLNPHERGGIAVPAVIAVDRRRRIAHRWVETTATRVTADGVLQALTGGAPEPGRRVRVGLGDMAMAIGNALRRGGTTPRE